MSWERTIPHLIEKQTKMEILLLLIIKIVLWVMGTNETASNTYFRENKMVKLVVNKAV